MPENDHVALAARLAALWNDRGTWAARTALGRRWVQEVFDWHKLAPRIADVYEDVTRHPA